MLRLALALALLPGLALAAPVLERVVVVARHGVRAPTKQPAALAKFSAQPWPDWPVGPGELTAHGAEGVRLMGAWMRLHYAAAGLVPASGCPGAGAVSVWADGRDTRTVASGNALLVGFAPGCKLHAGHGPLGQADPVFAAMESGACALTRQQADQALPGLQSGLVDRKAGIAAGMKAVRQVVDPQGQSAGCRSASGKCWWNGTNTIELSANEVRIKGPLATGASLAEDLSLEFQQGMQGATLGWGRLDAASLAQAMTVHNLYSGLVRRDPAVAGRNGAVLAARVLQALSGGPALTVFLGHDTNLDNLAAIFGLGWTLPGQPDATPPDGQLVFELYRDGGAETVTVLLRYQTALQLREMTPLGPASPPGVVALKPGYCGAGGCTVPALREQAARVVPAACAPHG